MIQPSRREAELHASVIQWAETQGWRGKARSSKKKIALPVLWTAFRAVRDRNPEDEAERVVLHRYLRGLEDAGKIAWLRKGDRETIELPTAVWLLPEGLVPGADGELELASEPEPTWHPELFWLPESWAAMTAKQCKAYVAINAWFWSRPDLLQVPIRERALEIFGEEKTFDNWTPGFRLAERGELLRLLRARDILPSLSEQFFRVGTGNVMLVVENITTAWSIKECLPAEHALGSVVWGSGRTFQASVKSVKHLAEQQSISEIRYFGDLDRDGLDIPQRTAEIAAELGLPEVRPAIELYSALLTQGKSCPALGGDVGGGDVGVGSAIGAVSVERVTELAGWLPEQLRAQVVELLISGKRLAQEWVGYRYLREHSDWHTDVR